MPKYSVHKAGGFKFRSFLEMCSHFGKNRQVVKHRIDKLQWTLEEALEIAPHIPKSYEYTVNGVGFTSIAELCRYFDKKASLVYQRIHALGYTLEQALDLEPRQKELKYWAGGLGFKSIKAMAIHFGVSPKTVADRIKKRCWSEEEAVGLVAREDTKSVSFRGKTYPSFNELCRSHGVNPAIARNRINRSDWTLEEALELKGRSNPDAIMVGGRQFSGWTEACRFHNLKVSVVRNRVHVVGWTIDEAFGLTPRPEPEIKYELQGNKFSSFSEMCRFYKRSDSVVRARMKKNGWSLEEALEIEPRKGREIGVKGFIYKITHIETGLAYVGITMRSVEVRWREHVERSMQEILKDKSGISLAIRHCGPEAFCVETLDKAMTLGELEAKERQYISQLNTLEPHGFNRNAGGAGTRTQGIKLVFEGVAYPSVKAAAEHYGVEYSLAHARLKRGWTDHEVFVLKKQEEPPERKAHNRKTLTVQGLEYDSIDSAAKHFGVPYHSVDNRLRRGWTPEQAVGVKPPPPRGIKGLSFDLDGVTYKNFSEAHLATGVPRDVFQKSFRQGVSPQEAVDEWRKLGHHSDLRIGQSSGALMSMSDFRVQNTLVIKRSDEVRTTVPEKWVGPKI